MEFMCPQCRTTLRINQPAARPSSPQIPSAPQIDWQSLPQPVRASGTPARHGSEFWHQSADRMVESQRQKEQDRARAANTRKSKRNEYQESSGGSVGVWLVGIAIGSVMLLLIAFGVGAAIWANSEPPRMKMMGFSAQANGILKKQRTSANNSNIQGVEVTNIWTGSGFVMVERDMLGVTPDFEGFMKVMETRGHVIQWNRIQRIGMDGIRYEFSGNSMQNPSHVAECFFSGGKVLSLMYIRGSDAAKYQNKRARKSREREDEIDRPEDFFASLQRDNN